MNNIKVYKLVDGSFVVGSENEDAGIIEDAIEVIIQPSPTGLSIALSPYMFPFNQEMTGMTVDLCNVLGEVDADENMTAQYTKVTTGIEVVQSLPAGSSKGGLKLVHP